MKEKLKLRRKIIESTEHSINNTYINDLSAPTDRLRQ